MIQSLGMMSKNKTKRLELIDTGKEVSILLVADSDYGVDTKIRNSPSPRVQASRMNKSEMQEMIEFERSIDHSESTEKEIIK